jgi:ribosomal protein S18 acetylase RimI-like enzyme
LFATASLAHRIERAERQLIAEGAAAPNPRLERHALIAPIAGGVAVFVESGSPYNKVAGLGFDGVPEHDALSELERQFDERECPIQVELSTLADPAIGRLLTQRGYELIGFENVLGLPLAQNLIDNLPQGPPDGSVVVVRAGPADTDGWMHAVTTGFMHPDTFDGPASHESFAQDLLGRIYADLSAVPSFERYIARREGEVAGGASLRIEDGVAQLCGAATLPEHRRRGVQTALLHHRLVKSARRGCDVAIVTTQPGSKSQQNVEKLGFALLYARAILVRPVGRGH